MPGRAETLPEVEPVHGVWASAVGGVGMRTPGQRNRAASTTSRATCCCPLATRSLFRWEDVC